MNFFNKLLVIFLLFFSGFALAQKSSHGTAFRKSNSAEQNWKKYYGLSAKDTITTQITGKITSVCQAKGCWMKVDLANGEEVFVKFKDYGFFVPKDVADKKVLMNGNAFIEEMSVDDQKHYAMDKGASKEAIAKITEPKKTLRFEASGVVIEP